ncbi:hypothetical protein ACFSYD_23665 [Paracoccus aerius]
MTIKDMVVQVDQTAASERRLEAAVKLSRHLGAHLTAVYLAAEPFVRRVSRLHLPDELVREYRRQAEAEADTVLSHVRRMVGAEVSVDAVMEIGPLDRLPVLFAHLARTADLAIVGEPDRDSGGTDDAVLVEVSFMDTGRPALVLPQAGTQALPPRRVLAAWNGTREASRAIHDAMPLLQGAEEVILVSAATDKGDDRQLPQLGRAMADHLKRHGVSAKPKMVTSVGTTIADLIRRQAAEEGADLVVMGATVIPDCAR